MLLRARRERGFDLARSYVIGDRMLDVEMARRVGAKAVLVPEPGNQYRVEDEIRMSKEKPDAKKKTFKQAVDWVLKDIEKAKIAR